mmetsp:Transcript_7939/g.32156  ORF Transcript_7939/g.32156 Transcript_7939/m.32156 type:complete len:421 (+) Transcript_7939:335-1597(+)
MNGELQNQLDRGARPSLLLVAHALGHAHDVLDLGQRRLLEVRGVGHGHVDAGDALDGRVEVVEGVLHDHGGNLRADASLGPALLDDDDAVGLADARGDGVPVQRAQGPEVDHLGLDTLLRELIRRVFAEADHLAEAHQRDVRAGPHDESLADGRHVVGGQRLLAHRERLAVHQLVLEEDDGVRVANRGFEQAPGVLRVVGREHLEARDGHVPGREALGVLGADARRGAVGPAEHDRAGDGARGHVQRLGRGVDDVVDGLHRKVKRHELDDWLEAHHRGAARQAGETRLGDGRVPHAVGAEALQEPLRDLVRALVVANLLAHHEDLLVAFHLLGQGAVERVAHGHDGRVGVQHGRQRRGTVLEGLARQPRGERHASFADGPVVGSLEHGSGGRRVFRLWRGVGARFGNVVLERGDVGLFLA